MNKERLTWVMGIILVPIIIYFYFLKWKMGTIYGDDLSIYKAINEIQNFGDKINMSISAASKYRPISCFSISAVIAAFDKNLDGYYIFNVIVQAINVLLLARIINLRLSGVLLSILISLTWGLSRITVYNITQLYDGGPLEGLAMIFFLSSLYYLMKILCKDGSAPGKIKSRILWSIVFANLCIYTHERYIVLMPFIVLFILIGYGFKTVNIKEKTGLILIAILSVLANIFIKTSIFKIPFLLGTSNTEIGFSFKSALTFLIDGLLSIMQINSGPEFTSGIQFVSLSTPYKTLAAITCLAIIGLFAIYSVKVIIQLIRYKGKEPNNDFAVSGFLIVLFFLLIAPAIVTIRLEQRWLQASLSILVIIMAFAIKSIVKDNRKLIIAIFSLTLIWVITDRNYLSTGSYNYFQSQAERITSGFKNACFNNEIKKETKRIIIVEKYRDTNEENGLIWSAIGGYLFTYYQGESKQILFTDSVYQRMQKGTDTTLLQFNNKTDQMVYYKDGYRDVSKDFLRDSLKNLKP